MLLSGSILMWIAALLGAPSTTVPTLTHGPEPTGAARTLVLTEDLRIGPDSGGDEFIWYGNVLQIEADQQGNFFIVDSGNDRIVMFDKNGKFVRQIGRRGEGPDEFYALVYFHLFKDGRAVAFQQQNFQTSYTHYNKQLEFEKTKKVVGDGRLISAVDYSEDGTWIAGYVTYFDGDSETRKREVFGPDYKTRISLGNFALKRFDASRMQDRSYWLSFLSARLSWYAKGKISYVAFDRDNNCYTAAGEHYEITKWNAKLEKAMVIKRNFKPLFQGEAEMEASVAEYKEDMMNQLPASIHEMFDDNFYRKVVETAGYGTRKMPINGLATMEDGSLLVWHDYNRKTRVSLVDIYGKDGAFLGSFSHPNNGFKHMIFKNGFAYTLETTEDDDVEAVRYRVALKPVSS
ncbi:6-bladed beta-propeller [Acanthopleuribacter pedis]|uniref:6-bladed beta-propeller n=1 Tax=Acanthopleuribacter pedis TaxID=442870 RepID=A0A8J7U4H5_9BACT|nr:6-bladed beta-propeller [Acanthopleuribacter pedis]MBO1319438.1 6-bladed beta-propeller [Acanthopleuribacter pedis]